LPVAPASVVSSGVGAAPLNRARALAWAFFIYRDGGSREGGDEGDMSVGLPGGAAAAAVAGAGRWVDGLEVVAAVAQELVLGPTQLCGNAAHHLLCTTMPSGASPACVTPLLRLQACVDGLALTA
jgi:hypothetical protein